MERGVHEKKELEYFMVEDAYGWNQDWFPELMMREGGCGAVTACESCIYFAKYKGREYLYPYNTEEIKKEDYINFAAVMKPYLRPRIRGISRLDLFIEGLEKYFRDHGEQELKMRPFHGCHSLKDAETAIASQIDRGAPVPYLLLKHKNPKLDDYVWHWFMLTGYEKTDAAFLVKAVTYGECAWLSLSELWDTGYRKKGGLILYGTENEKGQDCTA